MAVPPSSVASSGASAPPIFPNGVRAAPSITVLGMAGKLSIGRPRRLRSLMAIITVSARSGAPEDTAADTRVVGAFEDETLADPALQRLVELGEAKRALKKVAVTHEDAPGGGQRRVLIAGLGKRESFGAGAGARCGGRRRRAREGARRRFAVLGGA